MGIEVFDKDALIDRHAIKIVPPLIAVEFYKIVLSLIMSVDDVVRKQVFVVQSAGVQDGEWRVFQRLNKGAPDTGC
jgi:hypothetical protein